MNFQFINGNMGDIHPYCLFNVLFQFFQSLAFKAVHQINRYVGYAALIKTFKRAFNVLIIMYSARFPEYSLIETLQTDADAVNPVFLQYLGLG